MVNNCKKVKKLKKGKNLRESQKLRLWFLNAPILKINLKMETMIRARRGNRNPKGRMNNNNNRRLNLY